MRSNYNIEEVIKQFNISFNYGKYGNGHINDTFLIEPKKYVLQRINNDIFKNVEELMKNIVSVTDFLREKIIANGGDPDRETMTVLKTVDGKNYCGDNNGNYFRLYKFIDDTKTIDSNPTPEEFYSAARAFGKFQRMLGDFPAENIFEVIPDFHNTPDRFEKLLEAIKNDVAGRASSVQEEIDFALSCKDWISTVYDGIVDKSIPLRVTHNDTKINNVLFDNKTSEAICVIDLDTVMPGSMLYDFGDALRIGAATADEDETDLSKVEFDLNLFESFAKGFYEEVKDIITQREKELLVLSAKLLTYECGIRFLTDYLNGDTYFKIHREHHNLDRTRTQFKLVRDIEKKTKEMEDIINSL